MRIGNADTQPEKVAKAKGRWRPVLVREIHLARLTIAAEQRGLTPEDLADWALSHGLAVLARQDAIIRPEPPAIPQPPTGKLSPFVRSAPEASGSKLAGRPSSRHHQNGAARKDGSTAAKPGRERGTGNRRRRRWPQRRPHR